MSEHTKWRAFERNGGIFVAEGDNIVCQLMDSK